MAKTILDGDAINAILKRLILGTAIDDGVNQLQVAGSSRFAGPVAVAGALSSNTTLASGSFAVAALPAGANGVRAFAANGRKVGEAAGAGTGVPVYFSNGAWRRYSDDAAVAA
ncbi:hypothetical protein AAKU55_005933 [Oxalobacteraceae bacterium GrIS 1.11]